jgi:hypothetical protein
MTPVTAPPSPAGLDEFCTRLCAVNPFTDNRVNGPAPAVDVDSVHQAAFLQLTALAGEARDQHRGLGALLWGEAGVGKSHLLARLACWADRDRRACFAYLHNLQASPDNVPRSLLRSVISLLTLGQARHFRQTPLYGLVVGWLREATKHEATTVHPWPRVARAAHLLLDRLNAADPARAALADRTVYDVLLSFFHSAYQPRDDGVAALAVRWLSGDGLDPDDARRLGLPPSHRRDRAVSLEDNQQVKQVLLVLTRLALLRGQPFLLCFDQVDNLDDEQMAALARFLEALLDSSPNLLVITAGIQASLLRWRGDKIIQDSAWDRLAQFQVRLQRIRTGEAVALVAARLAHFLEPFRNLEPVRQRLAEDALFPLGRPWQEAFLKDKTDLRPRDVLNWAREGWRREQDRTRALGAAEWLADWGGLHPQRNGAAELLPPGAEQLAEAIDRSVDEALAARLAERRAAPDALPPDADHLAGLVQTLLRQCVDAGPKASLCGVEQPPVPKNDPGTYDLLLRHRGADGKETTTGLCFVSTASANSTTANLRRLCEDLRPPTRVWLITEQRRPLHVGSKGQEYLQQLGQRTVCRFGRMELTFEQYAELDALAAVGGEARSGDLEVELPGGQLRPVTEREVIASHQRRGRYAAHPLLRQLLLGD